MDTANFTEPILDGSHRACATASSAASPQYTPTTERSSHREHRPRALGPPLPHLLLCLHALRAHAAEDIVYVRFELHFLADGFVGMLCELHLAKGKICVRHEFHPFVDCRVCMSHELPLTEGFVCVRYVYLVADGLICMRCELLFAEGNVCVRCELNLLAGGLASKCCELHLAEGTVCVRYELTNLATAPSARAI